MRSGLTIIFWLLMVAAELALGVWWPNLTAALWLIAAGCVVLIWRGAIDYTGRVE